MSQVTHERLLTTREVADMLSVSAATIHSWRYHGQPCPPAIVIGNRLRFRREDVEGWITKQSETAEPEQSLQRGGRPPVRVTADGHC
jgi:excisionase family DNA binding protein